MRAHHVVGESVELSGLDGANPLGFLAAMGTLVVVHGAGERGARLSWIRSRTWLPALSGLSTTHPAALSELIANRLRGRVVPEDAERERAEAQRVAEMANGLRRDKAKEIRGRRLKGAERRAAFAAEAEPLQREYETRRAEWLQALADAVPRPELALGKRIDCTPAEYRQHANTFTAGAGAADRDAADLLAAFGSDACLQERSGTIQPTPFQFITGSGHQFFLETVRQLMDRVTAAHVEETLFQPWTYRDEGLSMRWDPVEDRRYALMDRDPTASGNKARTMWMANLLAYRALVLFPSAPRLGRLGTVGWTDCDDEQAFTWPLWEFAASAETIRSLVALRELSAFHVERAALAARGVAAAYRARRIKVGSGANFKLNFSPARAV